MLNLDLLGQIYLVSFLVGGVFIIFNVLIGQIGHASHDVHHLGLHHTLSDSSTVHNTTGASHSIGHPVGHSIDQGSGHTTTHTGHTDSSLSTDDNSSWLNNFMSGSIVERLSRRLLSLSQSGDISTPVAMFLISLLNPMRIAICLTFFGLFGLMISRALPFLSYLSMIPAALGALVIANLFSSAIRWLMDNMQSPDVHSRDDLIGTIASVSISIAPGKTGQIIYIADSVRCQSSAKLAADQEAVEVKRGTKVMIVGMEDQVALVEPVNDPVLLEYIDRESNKKHGSV